MKPQTAMKKMLQLFVKTILIFFKQSWKSPDNCVNSKIITSHISYVYHVAATQLVSWDYLLVSNIFIHIACIESLSLSNHICSRSTIQFEELNADLYT